MSSSDVVPLRSALPFPLPKNQRKGLCGRGRADRMRDPIAATASCPATGDKWSRSRRSLQFSHYFSGEIHQQLPPGVDGSKVKWKWTDLILAYPLQLLGARRVDFDAHHFGRRRCGGCSRRSRCRSFGAASCYASALDPCIRRSRRQLLQIPKGAKAE